MAQAFHFNIDSDTPQWNSSKAEPDHKATKRCDRFCLRLEIGLATIIAL